MASRPVIEPVAVISDEKLMRRVQAGDTAAFAELYDRYSSTALGLARLICGRSQCAEEAIQDGFLSVWRARASYDPARGSPRAWLLTVIRHRCIDLTRRGGHHDGPGHGTAESPYFPASNSIADDAERDDEAGRVRSLLQALPVRQREAIGLAYFGGLSHAEIAALLELPMGTVKSRIRLGLGRLRTEINPTGPLP